MGKELSLARQEAEGRSVLLASSRLGEPSNQSPSRDKRKEEANTSKGKAGRKAKDTPSTSKGSLQAERTDGSSRPKGHRRNRKDRESDRGDEGEDSRLRRTAQELGIEYPGSHCDAELTRPHRWIEVDIVDKGSLYRCSNCLRHLWLPLGEREAEELGDLIKKHGSALGYQKYLNRHRPAKIMVAKLQDLWYIRQEVKDDVKFTKAVTAIMDNKEYDRKEVKQ